VDKITQRELHDLLSALLDDSLRPEQQDRLGELLRQHAEARELYLAYFDLHADLALRGHAGDLAHLASAVGATPAQQAEKQGDEAVKTSSLRLPVSLTPRLLVSLSALAAGVLLVLVLWRSAPVKPAPVHEVTEAIDETVAVLLQSPGAEWDETGLSPRSGTALAPGWLRLRSGFAHLEFYSGATVILEAPAEFRLISRTEAYCARGKLRVTVPPHAQGFTIGTPQLELVDRGTEFGLHVGEAKVEVHVFQGKVDLYDADSQRDASTRRELVTGQGVRLSGPDGARLIPSAPNAFRTARDVAARFEEETRRRHDAWLAASEALCQDPSLLVYYPFQVQHSLGRTLRDHAGDQRQPHHGTIVGCSWVTGRWPGKQGLEFRRVSDRVRLHVPGTFESLTLVAWVRVDALPNLNNSLFMTDGWEEGGLHWQIGEAGKLVLGVKAPAGMQNGHYHAFDVFRPERFGQWIQLAVVYDRDQDQVTHYVDGRPAGRSRIQFEVPLAIGNAELGNWNVAAYRNSTPVRYFNGCMDEFLLFARALDDDEIERLYTRGRPPS
jgi:hypothetical protein